MSLSSWLFDHLLPVLFCDMLQHSLYNLFKEYKHDCTGMQSKLGEHKIKIQLLQTIKGIVEFARDENIASH